MKKLNEPIEIGAEETRITVQIPTMARKYFVCENCGSLIVLGQKYFRADGMVPWCDACVENCFIPRGAKLTDRINRDLPDLRF